MEKYRVSTEPFLIKLIFIYYLILRRYKKFAIEVICYDFSNLKKLYEPVIFNKLWLDLYGAVIWQVLII